MITAVISANDYQLMSHTYHSFQPAVFDSSKYRAFVRLYSYVFSTNHQYHFLGHTLTDQLFVDRPPLNYPNPFSFQSGTVLYYSLSKAATLDLYVFNLSGQQVVKKTFLEGMSGGEQGPNTVVINASFFDGYTLSPSIYIYILVDASDPKHVLGKGKLAVIP
tara:strand:- start:43 stop:528 length:486 start_codon:yes stop_codon:yes gene_type:complete